jgi:hypothetical protein
VNSVRILGVIRGMGGRREGKKEEEGEGGREKGGKEGRGRGRGSGGRREEGRGKGRGRDRREGRERISTNQSTKKNCDVIPYS